MRNGERPGDGSNDEPIVTGFESGIPPFGGGAQESDSTDNSAENDETGGELSQEEFEAAYGQYRDAVIEYMNLSKTGDDAKDEALAQKLKGLSAFSKAESGKIGLFMSYEEFVKSGHTLEELNELTSAYEELTDSIKQMDSSDQEADSISNESEGSKDVISEGDFNVEYGKLKDNARRYFELIILNNGISPADISAHAKWINESLRNAGFGDDLDTIANSDVSWHEESYADYVAKGLNLEYLSNLTAAYARLSEAVEKIRSHDDSSSGEADTSTENLEQLRDELRKAQKRFDDLYYRGGPKTMNKIDFAFSEMGERDALDAVVAKSAMGALNPNITPELIAEINRVAGIIEGLDLGSDDSGDIDDSGDSGDPSGDDGEGSESGEAGEAGEKRKELIEKLLNVRDSKRLDLLLKKIGKDNTASLEEVHTILNSLNMSALERIQQEVDNEAEDENSSESMEDLESLRKLNFGEWLALKYDEPGPNSKFFSPNFFAADRKLQQQVMQEYMALFEADANYEKDREFMVNELCRREYAQKALEAMGLNPADINMGDLEPNLNSMNFDELNDLYRKVVYGPAPKPAPGPKPAPLPNPADASGPDGSDSSSEPDSSDSSGEPDISGGESGTDSGGSGTDSGESGTDGGEADDVDADVSETIHDIDSKLPANEGDVRAHFVATPDARRIYGEPNDEMISKTLDEIKVWKKLSDSQKADFLQNGIVLSGINLNDLNALMELQKKGILPKRSA